MIVPLRIWIARFKRQLLHQLSAVFFSVKRNIKLPVSAHGSSLLAARTWTAEPQPALCNITELEKDHLLLLLCGKVLVRPKTQSAAAAGGFSCQGKPQ